MQTIDNLYIIDQLYPRILILELIEKTKGCAVTWDKISPTVYKAHWQIENRYYDVFITYFKTTYKIDFVRNGKSIYSTRGVAELIDLYQIIEIYLRKDDLFLSGIQNQVDCRHIFRVKSIGGVVAGGISPVIKSSITIISSGGVKISGVSVAAKFLPTSGGVVCGGISLISEQESYAYVGSGGASCNGGAICLTSEQESYAYVGSGGASCNGGAICLTSGSGFPTYIYLCDTEGGVVCGGNSIVSRISTSHAYVGSGGASCNGGAICLTSGSSVHLIEGTGGVDCGGEAPIEHFNIGSGPSVEYLIEGTGGVDCGGEAPIEHFNIGSGPSVEYLIEGSGGAGSSGIALVSGGQIPVYTYLEDGTGGVKCGSSAFVGITLSRTSTGGVDCSGVSLVSVD
jgi:hypothetical protein